MRACERCARGLGLRIGAAVKRIGDDQFGGLDREPLRRPFATAPPQKSERRGVRRGWKSRRACAASVRAAARCLRRAARLRQESLRCGVPRDSRALHPAPAPPALRNVACASASASVLPASRSPRLAWWAASIRRLVTPLIAETTTATENSRAALATIWPSGGCRRRRQPRCRQTSSLVISLSFVAEIV